MVKIRGQTKPSKCSSCGSSKIAYILYGMPDTTNEEVERGMKDGTIITGGCYVSDNNPAWQCINCGLEIFDKP